MVTLVVQYTESVLIMAKMVTEKVVRGGQNLYWHTKSVLKWFISSLNTVKQEMGQGYRYKICV